MNYEEAKVVLKKALNNDEIKKAEKKGAIKFVAIFNAMLLAAGATALTMGGHPDGIVYLAPAMATVSLMIPGTIFNYNYKRRKVNDGSFFEEAQDKAIIESAKYYDNKYPEYNLSGDDDVKHR